MPTHTSWILLVSVFILSRQVEQVSSDASAVKPKLMADTLEGGSPTPTAIVNEDIDDRLPQELYSYLSKGTVPALSGQIGRLRKNLCRSAGRLDIRQAPTCDPGYVLTCPLTEAKPCCPVDYPLCCVNNGGCCATGYVCAGTFANPACCLSGSIDCLNGSCCSPGTTCCGSTCCSSGYTCVQGLCVDPVLSSMSVQSIASIQSVSTISTQSFASVQSVASVNSIQASISSDLATQTGSSNPDTVTTAHVKPRDYRLKYDPGNAWFDTSGSSSSNSSPIGTCTNGTKVTQTAGAKFSFVFRGTSISVDIVPSSAGGRFAVAIDGRPPVDYSSSLPAGSSSDQCIASPLVSITGLEEAPHQLVVTNGVGASGSTGGKLEFSGITYTGKGAFGTPDDKSGPSPAVIGGSVGGAIGALVIGGIIFCLYRRSRDGAPNNRANNAGAGAGGAGGVATGNQMIQQANAPLVVSPYAGTHGIPSPTGSGHQPLLLQDQSQQFGYPQQPQYSYQAGSPNPSYQYGQGGPPSFTPVAPLANWIERASQPNKPGDAASMTSATLSSGMGAPVGVSNEVMQQPGAFYGSHYAPNSQVSTPGQ
ncbi:hypothetical protein FRC14_005410 [Serendipita sp. 396]|nr:hypothetical protein FRC14_005410 [Serendipita sp. 396]KAG8801433.1 hypothetical protein FRC16_000475 [Serendipita sp. 398]